MIQYSIQLYLQRLNILQMEPISTKCVNTRKVSFLLIYIIYLAAPARQRSYMSRYIYLSWCLSTYHFYLSIHLGYLLIPVNILWKKSKLNSIFNEARYIALHQMDYSHCHSFCILQNIRVIFKKSLFNSNIRCLANHKTDMILL